MDKVYVRISIYLFIVFGIVFIPLSATQEKIKPIGVKAQLVMVSLIIPPEKKKVKKVIKKPKPKLKPKVKPKNKPKPKPKPVIKPKKVIEPEPKKIEIEPKKVEVKSKEDENQKAKIAKANFAKKTYYNEIYEVISDNKKYPKKARRYKQEGSVKVSFKILRDGTITDLELLKLSKHNSLNKAVEKLFNKLKKFHVPPSNLSFPLELSITINYKLKR